MRLATAEEMREIDKVATATYGISPAVLMENAGAAVVYLAKDLVGGWRGKKVCLLSGKGNNGGDGFVVARHLENEGAQVSLFYTGDEEAYSEEAQVYLAALVWMHSFAEPLGLDLNWELFKETLAACDIVVDAMLGTGFYGAPREPLKSIINEVNKAKKLVVAVDIPSGVNGETGKAFTAIQADVTVTFGLLKQGLCFNPGKDLSGTIQVATIGIPKQLLAEKDGRTSLVISDQLREKLPKRPAGSHKGLNGFAGIIAGSAGMSGAALLAGLGALRAGAGKVNVMVPERLEPYCAGKYPELMVKGIGQGGQGYFTGGHVELCQGQSANWNVLAVGPGLGRAPETKEFILNLVETTPLPLVIDADGLYALKGERALVQKHGQPIIITPHLGEFSRLSGWVVNAIRGNEIEAARQFAKGWGVIVVLKGAPTVTALPSGQVIVNTTGNSGMATGGMGDVLTGIITGFMAQGYAPDVAAVAGVYLHGLAGDYCAETIGSIGYLPSDLAAVLPKAMQAFSHNGHV